MKTTSAVNQFGRNSTNASIPAQLMGEVEWLGIPCTGGACEIPHFKARTIIAADLHRHQINLYRCMADPALKESLLIITDRAYHEDELVEAQQRCRGIEAGFDSTLFATASEAGSPDVKWAADYYVCSWMGQGGRSGTKGEFNGPLSIRWDAQGGDSCMRYRSARESLEEWHQSFSGRVNFVVRDCFDFLGECAVKEKKAERDIADGKKTERRGLYLDPTWFDLGDGYKHVFSEDQHKRLAATLSGMKHHKIVMRWGDHPMVRQLYPEGTWTYHQAKGRNQKNNAVAEVFIVKGAIGGAE